MPAQGSSKMSASALAVGVIISVFLPAVSSAATPLFPAPLHLTRQVQDPISGSTAVLNEYAYGNRLISVRGGKTSIADYEKGQLIEIDREGGTYSITRFDELAKAAQFIGQTGRGAGVAAQDAPKAVTAPRHPLRAIGAKLTAAGRAAEFFQGDVENATATQVIEVGVDRSVLLSRDALEVLVGAAYPGVLSAEHEVVLAAAASPRRSLETAAQAEERSYALPIEQVTRVDLDGRQLEFRTSITRIGNEPPPADLIAVPAGARLVLSRIVAVQRELEQLDHPAAVVPRSP